MFQSRLAQAAAQIEAQLSQVMAALPQVPITRAMAYADKGGKRLRGFLVLESARLHGVSAEQAIWPACAIEALHSYSLVHDDLPCMDDDDMRRGRPTVHVAWDEATAVLAGDALHSLAFDLVSRPETGSDTVRAALTLSLARAAGANGMVLGQALDMAAETAQTPLSLPEITRLQQGKTGALFEWSATAGAVMAQADTGVLLQYARDLGLAFQIADDLLDVEGSSEKTGKRTGKDAAAGKATFVSLLGVDGAKRRAQELVDSAVESLSVYGEDADTLREAARFVIARET